MIKRALLALAFAAAALAPATAATRITFVTDWKAQAEHGGFYEALAEGLYKRRGLDVNILQGGPGGRGYQGDPARKSGERSFSSFLEQALGARLAEQRTSAFYEVAPAVTAFERQSGA